jgi:hypothetical protein
MCEEIVKIKQNRNYLAFSNSADYFLYIYDFCLKQNFSINSYLDNLGEIENFLYKFKYYTFPFSVVFTDSAKSLKLAEDLALEGKVLSENFLLTKLSGKDVYIPKLKIQKNKVYLYNEKIKEFDDKEHVKIDNKALLFFRWLSIFKYKFLGQFEYFVNDKFAFFEKKYFNNVSLFSEDLLNIYANYKQMLNERKFFIEEVSKLVLSAKLSGFRYFNPSLMFVSKERNIIFYLPKEVPTNDLVGVEQISVDDLPIKMRNLDFIDIEKISLVKFKELEYFSPHLLYFLKMISNEGGDVINA